MKQNKTEKNLPLALFSTPFSAAYWRDALRAVKSTRLLTTTALLCSCCALIDLFFLPIGGAFLRIYFSFLIAGVLCMVSGPVLAVPAGFLVDTRSFLFSGGDPAGYFPGYALSSMLIFLIYALFFFRSSLSLSRIFLAKITVNVLINVILGSVWKHFLYGKAYMVYFVSGAIKNIAMLPIEVLLMMILYQRLLSPLKQMHLIPKTVQVSIRKRDYLICVAASVIGVIVLIAYYRYKNP